MMEESEIRRVLEEARPSFYQYPFPVKVYLHWTAGKYGQAFDDYHFCIDADGNIECTRDLTETPKATYYRNTGSVAIALECCAGAMAFDGIPPFTRLGAYPPTNAQVESMAMLMAMISDVFDIPIDIDHFLTHAEAADNMDGYNSHAPYGPDNGCERWDLAVISDDDEWYSGGQTLRGKALFYKYQNS